MSRGTAGKKSLPTAEMLAKMIMSLTMNSNYRCRLKETLCNDGVDNDEDCLMDEEDSDCQQSNNHLLIISFFSPFF